MEAIVIGLVLAMIGLSAVFVLVAGVRNITSGKSEFKKIGILSIPFIIFLASYFAVGSAEQAGVITMMAMMGLMIVSIAFTGLKGTFKF